jgi:hypothetical protein
VEKPIVNTSGERRYSSMKVNQSIVLSGGVQAEGMVFVKSGRGRKSGIGDIEYLSTAITAVGSAN